MRADLPGTERLRRPLGGLGRDTSRPAWRLPLLSVTATIGRRNLDDRCRSRSLLTCARSCSSSRDHGLHDISMAGFDGILRDAFRPRRGRIVDILLWALYLSPVIGIIWVVTTRPYIPAAPMPPTDDRFVWGLQTFARGVITYQVYNGEYPEDAPSGQLPTGFAQYARPMGEGCWGEFEHFPWFWEKTPIGGRWDVARDAHGISAGVGVHFEGDDNTRDDFYLQRIDAIVDDGDLTSGQFRKLAKDRYYYVVAE